MHASATQRIRDFMTMRYINPRFIIIIIIIIIISLPWPYLQH